MGDWIKDALRRKLMSPVEQEAFLRKYGEVVRSVLETTLDAKVEELADRYLGTGAESPRVLPERRCHSRVSRASS